MTTVLAPLVDEVELVDAVEDVDGSVLSALVESAVPTLVTSVPITLTPVVEVLVEEVELLDAVLSELSALVDVREDRAPVVDELLDELEDDDSVEPVEVDPVEEVDVLLVEPPLVSCVATEADATPCHTMPTIIIPAATAAMRLTVVRRPGLISTLLPLE